MGRSTRTRSDGGRLRCFWVLGAAALSALAAPVGMRAQTNFWEPTSLALTSRVLCLASSPRGFIFAGTDDRKVVRTSNGGISWTDAGDPQLSTIIWSLAVDSLGTVFAGTDFRGVFRSTNDGASWVASGLPEKRVSCLLLTTQGSAFAGVWDEGIYRSTDGGIVWNLVGAPGHKVRSIAETPNGVFLAAADTSVQQGRVFRSSDGGDSWTRAGLGLSSGVVHSLTSISADTLFAGTAGQGIYRSTNIGNFWESSYLFLPTTVSALTAIMGEGVFAGLLEGGVLRTTNSGGAWFFEESGLLNMEVRALAPAHDGRMYAGTGEGVYRSVRILTGVAGTAGALRSQGPDLWAFPNPFNSEVILSFAVPEPGPVRMTAYDLAGRAIPILRRNSHTAGSHRVRWVADNLSSGLYLVVLETSEGSASRKVLLLK